MNQETRGLALAEAGLAVRADGDGSERFAGYAAVFNVRTAIGNPLTWGFYEQIAPGAFTKTLQEGDARMLVDHDPYYVVSRVSADTLGLAQDRRGLAVDSALDTGLSYVGDLKTNVRNRNIQGMSFAFRTIKDEWDTETVSTDDGNSAEVEVRTLREVQLIEVSAVTFPAYEETETGLRSVAAALTHRGDPAALERRAAYAPDLLRYVTLPEPATATRSQVTAPTAAPSRERLNLAMRGISARYGLPASPPSEPDATTAA